MHSILAYFHGGFISINFCSNMYHVVESQMCVVNEEQEISSPTPSAGITVGTARRELIKLFLHFSLLLEKHVVPVEI